MFYYLSFLRPPPREASLTDAVSITPQIANDLRTEHYAAAQDIFYAWSFASSTGSKAIPHLTRPKKLTVWRQSNAYKEIKVPLPLGIREGQACSLVLTAHDQGHPHVINLAGLSLGTRPFPVMSLPILFSSRSKSTSQSSKQEYVERVYRIPIASDDQVFMRVKERTSFDLDKKVWDSGIGLSSWIADLVTQPDVYEQLVIKDVGDIREIILSHEPRAFIELGAGTGIVSLTLGALRSANQTTDTGGCIIASDLASAVPLLEENVSANGELFKFASSRPKPLVLDWDEESISSQVDAASEEIDLILMADVTYNTASFPSLIQTLQNLVRRPFQQDLMKSPIIVMGYKERDSSERVLWQMARDIGIIFQRVGERCGAGQVPVEIWVGRIASPS